MFVEEATVLVREGLIFNRVKYTIKIHGIICDAPAKAYILGVKYFSGYSSCSKCEIVGKSKNKCVCFPGEILELRTNEKFKNYEYMEEGYQKTKTILTEIPGLGLVSQVPLDPMHLIYLGITRKLILMWMYSPLKKSNIKLPIQSINGISEILLQMKNNIPYEFARKPRHLKNIKFFKATEFRLFILYTGVVALKQYLDSDVYDNFVTLHVAIRILSDCAMCREKKNIDYAEKLLKIFVQSYEQLYGVRYVSHNVHGALHISDDVRRYGSLENFSAFRFENFIGCIKRLIRSGNNPLQQLKNRCAEIEILNDNPVYPTNKKLSINLRLPHNNGPLMNLKENEVIQFKVALFSTFKLNCDEKNCYVYIDNEHVVKILNIIKAKEETFIIAEKFKIIKPFYTVPCSSSHLGINIVEKKSTGNIHKWSITRITGKLLAVHHLNNLVVFPILHTLSDPFFQK